MPPPSPPAIYLGLASTFILSSPPSSKFTFIIFSGTDGSFVIEATLTNAEDPEVDATSRTELSALEMELSAVEVASSLTALGNRWPDVECVRLQTRFSLYFLTNTVSAEMVL